MAVAVAVAVAVAMAMAMAVAVAMAMAVASSTRACNQRNLQSRLGMSWRAAPRTF